MKRYNATRCSIRLSLPHSLLVAVLLCCSAASIRAQEYPPCVTQIGFPVYGSPGGIINITSLPINLPNSFGISGTLIVNQSTVWTGKQVYMFGGAQIQVSADMSFELSGTVLEGCDKMWKGIYMGGNAGILMNNEARISDAVSAIESRGSNSIAVDGGDMTRNLYGLNFYNCISPLIFNLPDLEINGTGPLKPPYPGQSPDLYGPRGRAGMLFTNLNDYLIDNSSLVTVRQYEVGAWIKGSAGTLQKTRFESIVWYNAKTNGIAVLIDGLAPALQIGNTVFDCDFVNCNMGIDVHASAFYITSNRMTTVNMGIRVRNSVEGYVHSISDNNIDGVNNGIMVNPNLNRTIHINDNTISRAAGYGIYLSDNTTSLTTSRYQILRCTIRLERNGALNPMPNDAAIGIWVTQVGANSEDIRIESNYVYLPGANTGTNNTGISVTACHAVSVRKNHVIQDIPNVVASHTGIYYGNSNFSILSCNDLTNTDKGLVVAGSNSSTQISTNRFNFHTSVGMLFQSITSSFFNGDHVHQGNLWLYPTDASNPGAISLLSGPANALHQFIVDAAENPAFLPYVAGDNWFVDQDNTGTTVTCDPYAGVEGPAEERSERLAAPDHEPTGIAPDIFPNPSEGSFTISWPGEEVPNARLELIDPVGRLIYAAKIDPENRQPVQIDGLMPGVYFVRISDATNGHSSVSKVIVQ